MNKKTTNYIGLFIGILLTLTILYVNKNYRSDVNRSEADFITYDINKTMVYDLVCFNKRGLSYCGKNSTSGYFFWYVFLVIGFWLSWKYRVKLGSNVSKIAKKIHDKA